MLSAITLREDFDGLALRGLAKKSRDANQMRHLLPLAEIYDGGSRGDAARIGGVGLQTIRDWVLRFNARGPAGLIDGKAPGRAPKLNDAQREALARIIESGPIFQLIDLAQWIWEEYRIRVAKQTLSRQLRAMGFRKLSARPRHRAHNAYAAEALKKLPRPLGADREPAGRGRQGVWFQDEARIGQKNKRTCRWPRRGTRLRAPERPARAGLVLPRSATAQP